MLTFVRLSRWNSLWNKCCIIRLILEIVGPKQEPAPRSAPTEVIVARVLDDESEIILSSKFDCNLGVLRLPNVDTDGRNTSLFARNIEGDVQITRIDSVIRE